MKSILDSRFKYTPAAATDIGARFKRMQRAYARMWEAAHKKNAKRDALPDNVATLENRRTAAGK